MHIAEGVLSPAVLAAGAAVAVTGMAIGLKKLNEKNIPMCAAMAAAFFIASLIHVPIGVTSAHLLLTGLCGVLTGWRAYPAIFTGLALQALLFQYGGLTTLGVNTACMGTAAVCSYYIFLAFRHFGCSRILRNVGAFSAGFMGVGISALLTACALAFTSEGFQAAAIALLLAHFPIMIAEGCVTAFAVDFLARYRPQMLAMNSCA